MKKIIIASIATAAFLVGCGSTTTTTSSEAKLPLVKTAIVHAADVAQRAEFTGSMSAYLQNNISPSMGLRIDNIHVDVGNRVKKGQLLVEMDKRQYLQSAVQLANLESDFLRMSKVFEEGGLSRQQLDQMETQLKMTRHATENLLENANLISPISGVVTERIYDPGDMYSPTAGKILTVMQIDRVKVQASVPERYFPQVKLGMPVDIRLEIYPDQTFEGKVSLIYPAIDAATRTFQVEVTVANPTLKLRPGMMCKATFSFGTAHHVLVPDISVQKQSGSSERYVFVVNADSSTSRRAVEVGRLVGTDYEILSGVVDGEQVVTAGMQKLLDGQKVSVVK